MLPANEGVNDMYQGEVEILTLSGFVSVHRPITRRRSLKDKSLSISTGIC